jgi:predicted MarR family transcription regulator
VTTQFTIAHELGRAAKAFKRWVVSCNDTASEHDLMQLFDRSQLTAW